MTDCSQCPANGYHPFTYLDEEITDLCLQCFRKSIPEEERRTAWRCHHCKVLNPWNKLEYLDDDKTYCDEQCAADRLTLELTGRFPLPEDS